MNMILLAFFSIVAIAETPDANDLLSVSDRARGAAAALDGVTWQADLTSMENGDKTQVSYALRVRGNDALAEAIAPPRQKGEIVLFNDRTIWFYKSGLKKPVSISPRQKLMGQAANGDIASTEYARDYTATSIDSEKLNGKSIWKLELKAKAKTVTYDRIRYWVSQDQKVAIKAEFLTVAGAPFKIAEFKYGNSVRIKGQEYPFVSEMRIQDANNPQNVTTIAYKNPRIEAHAVSLFNVNNLIK